MTLAPFSSRRRRGGQLAAAPAYRWDPRREMDEINSRFGQLMQAFLGEPAGMPGAGGWSPLAPPVDIEETEEAYVIDIDLPNVDPKDVNLEMRGEELRVSGAFQERERSGILRRQNRQTGEFEYLIDLPSDIDANRIEAIYGNGVLTVSVGRTREREPRRIEIHGKQEQQGQQGQQGEQGQQGRQGEQGQQGRQGQQQAGQRNTQQAGQRDTGERR